jgi:hypothetical protein
VKLITFGDSWVRGVGAEYREGMTEEEYKEMAWNESKYCFRNLVSKRLGMKNLNKSLPGSSNQTQFRKAMELFFGKNKIELKDTDVVLWGITSVYRTELWYDKEAEWKTIFLPDSETAISRILATQHHSPDEEIRILGHQMQLWNTYFRSMNVKNYWFSVFNDHRWDISIDNLLFENSSLLSMLIDDAGENNFYHKSDWQDEDKKIQVAKKLKLVNPISGHPTIEGHRILADVLTKELKGRIK